MFFTRFSDEYKSCTVECDPRGKTGPILGCAGFSDWIIGGMGNAGLMPNGLCQKTVLEAPDKAPDTTDPETYVTSCPDFFYYMGWDRGQKRTLINIRQEMVLKTDKALKAFKGMIASQETLQV